MQPRLSAFDASDKSRRVREEVLNSLEAFTYRARDYLEDETFIGASTSAIRKTLEEKLSAASDWIYAEGHDAAEDVLSARLKELKDLVDPVLKRKDESAKRPDAVQELKEAIDGIKSIVPMVKEQIESAAEASKKAEEEASKASATPSSAPSSATNDPLADLDDDTYSSSTSTSEPAAIPTPEVLAIYTPADLKFLEESIAKSEKWLEEKTAAQTKLKETEDAAFSIQEIKNQAKKLNDAVMEMMTKKMRAFQNQQQQQQKSKTKAKKSKTKKPKKSKTQDADAAAATESGSADRKEPTEAELADALEKAGLKGKGVKFENLEGMKDKDGKPLVKLDLGPDASEEDIMAAIDRATKEAKEANEGKERERDEL
jgi:hypoxia up-regulated 1